MKIAFDSQIFALQEYGGISRYFCKLMESFASMPAMEARIFAPLNINSYLQNVAKHNVVGCQIPRIRNTGKLVRVANQLLSRGLVKKYNPQIVHHTYYARSAYAPRAAARVVTVYDMIHERYPSMFSKQDSTPEDKIEAVRHADHVICISECTRRDLLETIELPSNKVSVIYLGAEGLQAPSEPSRFQQRPYLLYVGQRGGYKNFEGLLRAYSSTPALCQEFNLICFGGGVFTKSEIDLHISLGLSDAQVIYTSGDDMRLAQAYRDAAAFVYPSLYEGFGIPPLEAMSVSCPVACSNTSSIPEVAGDAVEYFQPEDSDSIRQAIERIVGSQARQKQLQTLGEARCKQFSWSSCADKTASVYKGLL